MPGKQRDEFIGGATGLIDIGKAGQLAASSIRKKSLTKAKSSIVHSSTSRRGYIRVKPG